MKIIKEDINGQGKERLWLATNIEELQLIRGLAKTAKQNLPYCPETTIVRGRLNNIIKTVNNYVFNIERSK